MIDNGWDNRAILEVVIALRGGEILTKNAKNDIADLIICLNSERTKNLKVGK